MKEKRIKRGTLLIMLRVNLIERENMKVKKLIKILEQAPQNIDVNIFDNSTEYLLPIEDIWIPKKEDTKDNTEVQLVINKPII